MNTCSCTCACFPVNPVCGVEVFPNKPNVCKVEPKKTLPPKPVEMPNNTSPPLPPRPAQRKESIKKLTAPPRLPPRPQRHTGRLSSNTTENVSPIKSILKKGSSMRSPSLDIPIKPNPSLGFTEPPEKSLPKLKSAQYIYKSSKPIKKSAKSLSLPGLPPQETPFLDPDSYSNKPSEEHLADDHVGLDYNTPIYSNPVLPPNSYSYPNSPVFMRPELLHHPQPQYLPPPMPYMATKPSFAAPPNFAAPPSFSAPQDFVVPSDFVSPSSFAAPPMVTPGYTMCCSQIPMPSAGSVSADYLPAYKQKHNRKFGRSRSLASSNNKKRYRKCNKKNFPDIPGSYQDSTFLTTNKRITSGPPFGGPFGGYKITRRVYSARNLKWGHMELRSLPVISTTDDMRCKNINYCR